MTIFATNIAIVTYIPDPMQILLIQNQGSFVVPVVYNYQYSTGANHSNKKSRKKNLLISHAPNSVLAVVKHTELCLAPVHTIISKVWFEWQYGRKHKTYHKVAPR